MRLPHSWIRELSGVDWPVEEMVRRLTAVGLAAVAEVCDRTHFDSVVVGEIVKLEKHPQADRLTIATVSTGDRTHQVVCGAPNCAEGQKVALALPGANLRGEFPVKEITMRGVRSAGMICAEDELGLSDDHAGIIVLDADAQVGRPVFEQMNLNDAIINFEITPNRPDALCAVGVARELSVIAGKPLSLNCVPPAESKRKASDYITVVIDDPEACPRYAARIIDHITVGESPRWLKKRLLACGIRPINNIVDVANYVMLEMGQPLHAFDYNRFGSRQVSVRRARSGEKLVTLDGQTRTLDDRVLLITNGKNGVAAAGVMGGQDSEVSPVTTTILLESAYFNPTIIRRSARKLGLSSEASYRFERGVDPNGVILVADRAAILMAELGGGEVLSGVVDCYPKTVRPVNVSLRPQRVKQILGVDVGESSIERILTCLGMTVEKKETFNVTVPTFRPDVEREIDLIEEVARIYGLDKIPVSRHNSGPLYTPTHRRDTIKDNLRQVLVGLGFDETVGTGFAHPERMRKIDESCEPIRVLNSLSDEFGVMRPRLLYSLLVSAGNNIRRRNVDIKIFEIGRVYLKDASGVVEPEHIGFLVTGRPDGIYWKRKPDESDLFEIKGVLATLLDFLGLGEWSLVPAAVRGYDNSQSYEIHRGERILGYGGCVESSICRLFDIKQDCFAVELKLEEFIAMKPASQSFRPLPKYPASSRDMAVIVDEAIPVALLLGKINEVGGSLVESVTLFDLFTGSPVPAGKKSVAFSIRYRAAEKTLEDKEVDLVHGRIVEDIEKTFKARLRE